MLRLQAFKFRLAINGEQRRNLRRFAGACRFVYNKALAWQSEQYKKDNATKFSYNLLANLLPELKKELCWLKEAPSQSLQQALKDLESAYKNCFAKRAKFPRFKKKGQSDSCRFPQGFKLEQETSRIFLPKLGWISYRNSREVLGTVKNITVSQSGGQWYASIQSEREIEQPIPQATSAVGIDMGIVRFATLSTGEYFKPLNSFKRHETALRKTQQWMKHKTKFGKNWRKLKTRLQKLHARIAKVRGDYLHKITKSISQKHAMVCVEDLQVRNMSKSATGTLENPGRQVKAKSGLNKAILDQGWYELRRQLDYKLAWNGGHLITVPAKNTSRTYPSCGQVSKENRKTQAAFQCVACGYQENADVVGAINVLRAGYARLACEVSGAVKPPAAGTRRSASQPLALRAVGIPSL